MSFEDQALPAVSRSTRRAEASAWFWQFLKNELAPYPGRSWVVGRIVIAATIDMVLVMTFRIPFGYLGAICAFVVSRESPTATLRSGITLVIVTALGTMYMILGVTILAGDPLTHFLWITASVFLVFYLLSGISNYFAAIFFGAVVGGIIPIWDLNQLTVEARTEATLWVCGSLALGAVVTITVEYTFHWLQPVTVLIIAIDTRLQAVEDVLRQIAMNHLVSSKVEKEITRYSALGTSRARQQLLHSDYPRPFVGQLNTAVALLGHLIDLAATLRIVCSTQSIALSPAERGRCLRIADGVSNLRCDLKQRQLPRASEISAVGSSGLPLITEMERTVALIPHAFSSTASPDDLSIPPQLGDDVPSPLFVTDCFSNIEHFKFAVRGMLATMLAYVIYQAVDWPGLSTAVVTCILTALSTIGSSTQKQFLRLGGAIIGGFIFGMVRRSLCFPILIRSPASRFCSQPSLQFQRGSQHQRRDSRISACRLLLLFI
jgi:multidrug resistance protein MdtO